MKPCVLQQKGKSVSVFECHGQDSRCKPMGDICETVSAKYGTGGNNTPLVVSHEDDDIRGEPLW